MARASSPLLTATVSILVALGVAAVEETPESLIKPFGFMSDKADSISPEIIFITSKCSRGTFAHSPGDSGPGAEHCNIEVAKEFRFHFEQVSLAELEQHGFNREAPVSFVMHGFTSGYPLQAWISAIVESYTIHREGSLQAGASGPNRERVNHNLFIINWEYASRGYNYFRAVRNIAPVASIASKFIREKLLGEASMDPLRIQLIGHSLGAHLAGSIGKDVRPKLGRIYGLDPAGPCFGAFMPGCRRDHRLELTDADQVITVHTNTKTWGINKPLGKYSVFVEGGAIQPGCDDGSLVINVSKMFIGDAPACSHSRAPNLFTHQIDQSDWQDDCQMVAYECKDWNSFTQGHCGICDAHGSRNSYLETFALSGDGSNGILPPPVDCLRVGLDWQYPDRLRQPAAPPASDPVNAAEEPYQADPKMMFIRTGDTQPYCAYQYQVVLELNEPFPNKAPAMSMVLQDSILVQDRSGASKRRVVPNSINVDDFGHKYNDRVYTRLVTSTKKLRQIYHATLLIPQGLTDGQRIIKALHINYMSHADPEVRKKLSSRLCLLNTDMDRNPTDAAHHRFFFQLCDEQSSPPAHDEL